MLCLIGFYTMEVIKIDTTERNVFGKKNRALRRGGIIPVHVYGLNKPSLSLQIDLLTLTNTLRSAGRTTPVTLKIQEEDAVTLIRDVAQHPVSGHIQHVDFLRVDVSQMVNAPVPIILTGQELAPGTAGGAGIVTQGLYEITVRAKPFDVPSEIKVDCSVLDSLESSIMATDLNLPPNVELVSTDNERIAWIQPPRVEEVVEPVIGMEEEEEVEESVDEEGEDPVVKQP